MFSLPAAADEPSFQDELLDKFVGTWVLRGTMAGGEVTHDIVAGWTLGHQYMKFDEVSREIDDAGKPLYEATVFIGWDQPSGRYVCQWLDSTGGVVSSMMPSVTPNLRATGLHSSSATMMDDSIPHLCTAATAIHGHG